jgi:hypothetical protein
VCRALTALCVLLAFSAGCGSGGEKRLSKEAYAKRADATCRRYNEGTRRLGTPQSMPALAKVADRSLPLLDRAIRDLRALKPPEDEEATARTWLRQLSLLRGDIVRIRNRARANDARGVRAVVPAATKRNERFSQLATELGMSVCSRP